MKRLLIALIVLTGSALAQPANPGIVLVGSAPSGSCSVNLPDEQVVTTGALYSCQSGTWAAIGGSSSCPTCVLAVSPGAGIAHFAGSTQTVTSSLVSLTADVSGVLPLANGGVGNFQAPSWLRFFGDGSDGALNVTSGTTTAAGEHWYSSVNVSVGAILANNGAYSLIIRSTGTCTIAGTISGSVNTGSAAGNNSLISGWGGGTSGGSGGGTAAGVAGIAMVIGSTSAASGGTAGAASGGSAGNGATVGSTSVKYLYSGYVPQAQPNAAGMVWGGMKGPTGGSGGGVGGNGGTGIVLACPTINFTGTVDVSGGAGTAAGNNNQGGGGGGGGGVVIMAAETYSANTGTITLTGGNGGGCASFTGCGTGGNGGSGNSKQFTIQ